MSDQLTLLFVTQKVHQQDAFALLWIRAFQKKGYRVIVVCLEKKIDQKGANGTEGTNVEIHSMGKEMGKGKVGQVLTFWKLIMTLKYDRVFLHMSPVWGMLGSWYWIARRIPVYLWYTHYKLSLSMRVTGWYAKRFFCATPQSLPQYDHDQRKVVVGHGIDLDVWKQQSNRASDPYSLLVVHRLSRSKRLELSLGALSLLPSAYHMTICGIEAEQDYAKEMRSLVSELKLDHRVAFKGTVPMEKLNNIYPQHRFILNMASETIDKTMLEAMTAGCYPVTTQSNSVAIGIPFSPSGDSPQTIADFILRWKDGVAFSADEMYRVVKERHALDRLIDKMDVYIAKGI